MEQEIKSPVAKGSVKEAINQFLATGQRAHSMTFEEVNCDRCGKTYKTNVHTDLEGKKTYQSTCQDCRLKMADEGRYKYLTEHLGEEVDKVKDTWVTQVDFPGNLFEKILDKQWDSFDRKLQPKAFDVIKNFKGNSIVLASPDIYGVGKSHLACLLAWDLYEHTEAVKIYRGSYQLEYKRYKCPVKFITEVKLLTRIRATYNRSKDDTNSETEEDVFNDLLKYDVLIIDDVGKVRPKDYSFLQGVYFRIIDERYTQEKTIVLTTNLNLKELEEHIGGACADRLVEMCGKENMVTMTGKSYRKSLGTVIPGNKE